LLCLGHIMSSLVSIDDSLKNISDHFVGDIETKKII